MPSLATAFRVDVLHERRQRHVVGTALSQDLSPTWPRRYTARRAPMRELPRRRCRPNHGADSPSTMVSSHSEISASSTAVALRSTPYTLCSAR